MTGVQTCALPIYQGSFGSLFLGVNMKKFIVKTHEQCIVEYDYVIEAENEYDAVRRFVTEGGFNTCDHQVIADIKVLKFASVDEIVERT